MSDNELLTAARRLRQAGLSLIPIGLDKSPLLDSWKRYQVTPPTDEEFEAWAIRLNAPAWAALTGERQGIAVLDFDGPTGNETMHRLGLEPHVRTGSGGHHVYFKYPEWPVRSTSGKTAQDLGERYPGIDVKGEGGYVICLGRNVSGSYTWLQEFKPCPVNILPKDLRRLMRKSSSSPDVVDRLITLAVERAITEGRNNAGFWLSCQFRDAGLTERAAVDAIKTFVNRVPGTNRKGMPEEYSMAEALSSIRQAFNRSSREPLQRSSEISGLTEIEVGNRELRDGSMDCLAALRTKNATPVLYVRSGQMVQVVTDEKGRHTIAVVSEASLRGHLTRSANFKRSWLDRGGNRRAIAVNPPLDIVRDLLALPPRSWEFPALDGVVEVPIIRPDGTILSTPGYDPATHFVYAPPSNFRLPPISMAPGRDEIASKLALIHEMVGEFPVADRASYANLCGLFLTALLRLAIKGNVPIALLDAPAAGTGKTLLSELLSIVLTGSDGGKHPAPENEEEMRKALTSVLSRGQPLTIFDNLAIRLASPSLALAVTTSVWADRILGESRIVTFPQNTVWVITGNNIVLGGDIPRRTYWIRLDAKCPRPWQGRQFKIDNLKDWVQERRGDIVAAFLTLARAWFVAGKPAGTAPILGGFEGFCRTIGGILTFVGIEEFLGNLEDLYEQSDPAELQWQLFLEEVYRRYDGDACSVNTLVKDLRMQPEFHALLPDDLVDDERKGNLFQRKVGNAFRQRVERRYGPDGVHLVRDSEDKGAKVVRWRVTHQNDQKALSKPPVPAPPPSR